MRKHRAVGAESVIIAAALLIALVNVFVAGHLRQILSLPLLVLPGWALCRAIFPAGTLEFHERLTLSGCLAIAVLVVLGLGLNALPGGLDQESWEWSLIAVTLGASAVELWVAHVSSPALPKARRRVAIGSLLGGAGALLLLGGGLVLAQQSALTHDSATRFTALWMLPDARRGRVTYGVTNDQGRAQRYELRATLRGGRITLLRTGWFSLAPGQSRTGILSVPVTVNRGATTVILDLFRAGSPSPYRSTTLTVR